MLRKSMCILMAVVMLFLVGCSSTTKGNTAAPATPSPSGGSTAPASTNPKDYFKRPVTFTVPYAAGSSVDINARAIAPSLERALGVSVVIENKEGGGNAIGVTYTSQQKPDGYSFGIANLASLCIPNVLGGSKVDPSKNLDFVGTTVTDPFLIFVRSDSPYKTLKEVVDKVKASPKSIRFGGSGATSTDAMMCYNIQSIANVQFNFVGFGADSEVIAAILGGHIDVYASSLSGSRSLIKDGKIKAIAVGGDKRLAELPDVQTTKEQGFDLAFNMAKRAIYTPANLEPAAKAALSAAIKTAVADPDFVKRCTDLGLTPTYLGPEDCKTEVTNVMKFLNDNKATFAAPPAK